MNPANFFRAASHQDLVCSAPLRYAPSTTAADQGPPPIPCGALESGGTKLQFARYERSQDSSIGPVQIETP